MNQNEKKRRKRLWQRLLIGLLLFVTIIIAPLFLGIALFFPKKDLAALLKSLPNDEEMISNFNKHREDFYRLAQTYQKDLSVPTVLLTLRPTPEIKAIMNRINVSSISGDQMVWLPPVSTPTEARVQRYLSDSEVKRVDAEGRMFSGVFFRYANAMRLASWAPVYKEYYYIPVVPEERGGILILPGTPATGYPRIVQTLDTYPPKFGPFECACRPIEPHWFIRMCEEEFQY